MAKTSTLVPLLACVCVYVGAVGLCQLFLWLSAKPAAPNPWDEDTEAELHGTNAVCLCPRCLEPDRDGVQFCRDCGFAVGPYVTWMPYLHIFAIGDMLRTGVDRPFRLSVPNLIFLLMISASEYAIFAPVYWFFLVRNILRQTREHRVSGLE